jgi:hypothetical protein
MSEFSRMVDLRGLGDGALQLSATPSECAALARRFGLIGVNRVEAEISLVCDGAVVTARGRLRASVIQSCAVSAEDLPAEIAELVALRFVPEASLTAPVGEIELDPDGPDEIPYSGRAFDLGEEIAQCLAMAIDPFAVGPEAQAARKSGALINAAASGPFAALAALRGKPN